MDSRVAEVINLMRVSLATSLSISTLAKRVNLSSTRLRQLFKAEVGRSPTHYLRDLRMQNAEHLLTETFLSVKEIAFVTGYKHVSSFAHAFKRRHGLTPSEYRAQTKP